MSVYFMTCRKANAVKIGCSVDPHGRLREIQLGCPLPIKLEAFMPGMHEEEKIMHGRFSDHRIHGEWFRLSPEIEFVIEANPPKPRLPDVKVTTADLRRCRRLQRKLDAKQWWEWNRAETRRANDRALNKRIASGDIHFPFRGNELAALEDE